MWPHTPAVHDCSIRTRGGDAAAGLRALLPEGWWTRLAPEAGSELRRWCSAGSQCWPREMPLRSSQPYPCRLHFRGNTDFHRFRWRKRERERGGSMGEGAPHSEPRNGLDLRGGAQQAQGGSGSRRAGLFGVAALWAPSLLPKPVWPSVIHLGLADRTKSLGCPGTRKPGPLEGPRVPGAAGGGVPSGNTVPGLLQPCRCPCEVGSPLTGAEVAAVSRRSWAPQPGLASGADEPAPGVADGTLSGSSFGAGVFAPAPPQGCFVLAHDLCLFLCAKRGAASEASEAAEGWPRLASLAPGPRAPGSGWAFQSSGAQSRARS